MSKYIEGETRITNEECLLEALKALGYDQVEVHETPQPLVGYQGDTRAQKANVIVRRKYIGGASNDLGFVRQTDGKYTTIISAFDQSALTRKHKMTGSFEKHIATLAAEMQITKEAAKRGMKVVKTTEGSKVTLSLMRVGG